MANDNSKVTPIQSDQPPLDWLSTHGMPVIHHLQRVNAIAQITMSSGLKIIDDDTILILLGIVMDEVNTVTRTLDRRGAS